MTTVKAALQRASELQDSDSARLDTELLLAFVLGKDRTWLYTWPEKILTDEQAAQFAQLLERRKAGEPVAHLTGRREFWTLNLHVDPNTLIPRPDTELMVEIALELPLPERAQVLDLGTGTGAIALAIASEMPGWQVTAVDRVEAAVQLAERNRAEHGIGNARVLVSDWYEQLAGQKYDLIVSNPPYIAGDDPHLEQGDVRFEPSSALVADDEGLADIRKIAEGAQAHLVPGGWLMVEHGWQQAEAVRQVFSEYGFGSIESRKDLAGWERVTLGLLGSEPRRMGSERKL
ncbi:peptide chain release factor N(5)-glutamine methyltransferase [Biformimicrobium ophioploci]|uniref:Release factor glutamine methyltransferase n=1 Tax=Biformimicrobium ophioploci TaxID=3036711 RepID=A0ABQ6LWV8_9GAMM|nr:peptide chain release factor N(5)-glutamine methyltransferase [Microbulbifer sp. NKW57]GMG86554.1 peptide chain release factor N(5)-glutamine methyltransferase [Microbulbifer sp. NKW57]